MPKTEGEPVGGSTVDAEHFLHEVESAKSSEVVQKLLEKEKSFRLLVEPFLEMDLEQSEALEEMRQVIINFILSLDKDLIEQFVSNPANFPAYGELQVGLIKSENKFGDKLSSNFVSSLMLAYTFKNFEQESARKILEAAVKIEGWNKSIGLVKFNESEALSNGPEEYGKKIWGEKNWYFMEPVTTEQTTTESAEWLLMNLDKLPQIYQMETEFKTQMNFLFRAIDSDEIHRKKLAERGNFYHIWRNATEFFYEIESQILDILRVMVSQPEIIEFLQEEKGISSGIIEQAKLIVASAPSY